MKKLFTCSLALLLLAGCATRSELYSKTDSFVESLETTYESYGMLGGSEHAKTTEDGLYTIRPIGRLIK